YREQGREGCAPEGYGARVDERRSARGGPEGRDGEPSPQAGTTAAADTGRQSDRQHARIDSERRPEPRADDGNRQSALATTHSEAPRGQPRRLPLPFWNGYNRWFTRRDWHWEVVQR